MYHVPLQLINPWEHNIEAVADTGANLNAISMDCAYKLYKKHIMSETRSFRVRTGGGYISCKDFIIVSIRHQNNNIHHIKFHIIPDLPFDYLVGRPLLNELGYQLTNISPNIPTQFHHEREDLDTLPDEDIVHDPYPLPLNKTQIQQPKAKVANRDKKLTEFIIKALAHNTHICAQGEFDIGCIPNAEFKIEFKSNVDSTPIRCAEYPHNIRDVGEIERQLRLMIKKGLITRSNSPWRFPTFIVPKKNGEARIVFDYRRLNSITKRMSDAVYQSIDGTI